MKTTRIYKSTSTNTCNSSDFCIDIDTIYDNGLGRWIIPVINLPALYFTAGSRGYVNGDKLILTCPINHQDGNNKLVDRIKFITQPIDVTKCNINKVK